MSAPLLLLLLCACSEEGPKLTESASPEDTDTAEEDPVELPGLDADGDGAVDAFDCDDADPSVHPGAPETCDGRDEDCDGEVDEDATDAPVWYADADEDGFAGDVPIASCARPEGTLEVAEDCDDADDEVYPGAPEVCDDEVVNDCDGDAELARVACTPLGSGDVRRLGLPFQGLTEGGDIGVSLSQGADANGDGKADLLIGGPGAEGPDGYTGGAFLLYGPLSTNHVEYEVDGAIYGEEEGQETGFGVSMGPDMDGDGKGELLAGAPGVATWGEESGGAAFFYGPVGGPHPMSDGDALIVSDAAGRRMGASASMGGDLDGDAVADLLLGSDEQDVAEAGVAWVFLGPLSGLLGPATADATLLGGEAGDRSGAALSARGDADGDGILDVVVGAPGGSGEGDAAGLCWLALGPVSGARAQADADALLYGPGPEGDAGAALSFGGDVDGDGYDDLLVGSPGYGVDGGSAGVAWLISAPAAWGSASLIGANASVSGADGELLGRGLALEGDYDGDGNDDLVIGVPGPEDGTEAGEALIWYGPVGGSLDPAAADYTLLGRDGGDRLGWAVDSAGDTDDDGLADLLLGAIGDEGSGAVAGTAWQVFSGGI